MAKNRGLGLAIAFDGPDGVGKSTQVELTARWLESLGYTVYQTRFSGAKGIGEELRKASLSDHERPALTDVYISLAMGTALAEDLAKHVKKGEICLIDRSPLCIMAYNTYGSQLANKQQGVEATEQMFKAWNLDALLTLDASQAILDARRSKRTDKPLDYFEKQGPTYHARVQEGYAAGIKLVKDNPSLVDALISIDAEPDIETIQATIQARLEKML